MISIYYVNYANEAISREKFLKCCTKEKLKEYLSWEKKIFRNPYNKDIKWEFIVGIYKAEVRISD